MTEPVQAQEYLIETDKVCRYFYWRDMLIILAVGIWVFGIGLVLAVLYVVFLGPWLPRRRAAALRYWLEGSTLRIDQGVYFLQRKAIPLDRVTDVVLTQGPLMRRFGIWGIHVQTAGTGQPMPEGVLYGLQNAAAVRDGLLAARDAVTAREGRGPAA